MKLSLIFLLLFSSFAFSQNNKVLTIDEIIRITPEMSAFLEENIPESSSHHEKLAQLIRIIFNENFLHLSYNNQRTKTASATFTSRSGNCLSFTNMFVVMARHLGLQARFQEIRNLPTWDRRGRVVVMNRHINVLVFLREKKVTVDFNPYQEHKRVWAEMVKDERAYAQFFNNFGAEAFASGHNQIAIAHFKRSMEIDPKMSFSKTNLGVVYSNMGQYELAETTYHEALKISNTDLTAVNNLASLYRKMGNFEKAASYQKRGHYFRKKNPYYHFRLGMSAYRNEDYSQAVTHFKRAIRRKKVDHQFYFAIAKAYAFLGKMAKATENLQKARAFAPEVFDRDRYSQKLNMLATR